LAKAKRVTLARLVLQWTLERPGITIALAGARNEEQSVQNAGAAILRLNSNKIDFIDLELERISPF
jgi:aryl-alcohol dehydrogenase-like predicted oxidoreductase